jgi:hypothetical protein
MESGLIRILSKWTIGKVVDVLRNSDFVKIAKETMMRLTFSSSIYKAPKEYIDKIRIKKVFCENYFISGWQVRVVRVKRQRVC